MESKAFKSLQEAAIQVQLGDTTQEPDISDMVLEYFENYFGDNLNEDISDEDIMNAVYDLINLTEAVCEAATFIPNNPDVDKYYGGKKKADALRRRLGQKVVGDDVSNVKRNENGEEEEPSKKKKKKKRTHVPQHTAVLGIRQSPYSVGAV